jgi:hypothetical protein
LTPNKIRQTAEMMPVKEVILFINNFQKLKISNIMILSICKFKTTTRKFSGGSRNFEKGAPSKIAKHIGVLGLKY